jgi:predicted nucleotidyltransferase
MYQEYSYSMPINIAEVREFLSQKDRQMKERRHVLFEKATDDFNSMISHISRYYGHITVYQWGSLLNPEDFDELSDIDIALEGVGSAELFFKLYGELMKMTDFPLDIVELDKIDPVHSSSIKEKGRLIYGSI